MQIETLSSGRCLGVLQVDREQGNLRTFAATQRRRYVNHLVTASQDDPKAGM